MKTYGFISRECFVYSSFNLLQDKDVFCSNCCSKWSFFKENINCSTDCTIQQPNVEPTLLWLFKAQKNLDSKRIKLFLPLCLPHFYGDQNIEGKSLKLNINSAVLQHAFWRCQSSSCCMKQIQRKKLGILQQCKCKYISVPQILKCKNICLNLTFLGDLFYMKVLLHWLLVLYIFCEWTENVSI